MAAKDLKAEIEAAAERFWLKMIASDWQNRPIGCLADFALSQVHAQIERDAETLNERVDAEVVDSLVIQVLGAMANKIRAMKEG